MEEKMNDKIYVIAGTRNEYEGFSRKKAQQLWEEGNTAISLSHFVFVHSVDQLRGLRDIHGYFIGTFARRSDINQLKHCLCFINNVPLTSLP